MIKLSQKQNKERTVKKPSDAVNNSKIMIKISGS